MVHVVLRSEVAKNENKNQLNQKYSAIKTPRTMQKPISYTDLASQKTPVCVIGLGYVGLPLAIAFAKNFSVIGIDINTSRVNELKQGVDRTREVSSKMLKETTIQFTADPCEISKSRFIIVTVPTPIDVNRRPDLSPLCKASRMIGNFIQPGSTVVYESTVYPGCTEEECLPIIEKESGLKWGVDFFAGYSPERINPGDKEHTVQKIKKIVSGDSPSTTELIARTYGAIIIAGIHIAPTIKIAEAAKVIENTQRDLNIALMNELALIFDRQGINTLDVLEAAGTKWNFLPFRPGLVGGHCIGVDPYYLTFKAENMGYHPEVILSGRRINDAMGKFVAEKTVKQLIAADRPVKGAKVLIVGWTFKENVPDIRNTRVVDIYRELQNFGVDPVAYDPLSDNNEIQHEYGFRLIENINETVPFAAIILAVKHNEILRDFSLNRLKRMGPNGGPIIIDVKGFFKPSEYTNAGLKFWQL